MGFARAVRTCLAKYATFAGRASRPEYWWFVLFLVLVEAGAGVIDTALLGAGNALLGPVVFLATLMPWLAVGWRRMHDTGRSGMHFIYPMIVIAGISMFGAFVMGFPEGPAQDASMLLLFASGLVFLVSPLLVTWWLTRPSDPNPNRYGPPPVEVIQ